jgi:hypothetical protein
MHMAKCLLFTGWGFSWGPCFNVFLHT